MRPHDPEGTSVASGGLDELWRRPGGSRQGRCQYRNGYFPPKFDPFSTDGTLPVALRGWTRLEESVSGQKWVFSTDIRPAFLPIGTLGAALSGWTRHGEA